MLKLTPLRVQPNRRKARRTKKKKTVKTVVKKGKRLEDKYPNLKSELIKFMELGYTAKEVAFYYGITDMAVLYRLKRLDIPYTPRTKDPEIPVQISKEKEFQLSRSTSDIYNDYREFMIEFGGLDPVVYEKPKAEWQQIMDLFKDFVINDYSCPSGSTF